MDDHDDQVQRIQLLLSALFLSDRLPGGGLVERAPGEWVAEWLGLEPHRHFGPAALRHLVAVQLAPQAAISYDRTNPRPRWRLIDDFLSERAPLDSADREHVARVVAGVLDRASAERGRPLMAVEHASACAICRLPFHTDPMSVTTRDPLKPVWQAREELCRPEVDHVIAISGLGAHRLDNLQVVCRACNLAKGSHLIVDPEAEIRYAGVPTSDVPRIHLLRLLQWLIQHHGGRCANCAGQDGELTMRLVHPGASLARTNLRLVCYACVAREDGAGNRRGR